MDLLSRDTPSAVGLILRIVKGATQYSESCSVAYLVPFAQAAEVCFEAMLGGLIGELLGDGLCLTLLRAVQYQEAG